MKQQQGVLAMPEIGIGHNSGSVKKSEKKKPAKSFYQLDPSAPSILDLPPGELKKRRLKEAAELLKRGQCSRGISSGPLAVRPNDHHKRVDVCGKSRCQIGTADDLTTAAPDDELANHLYIADDPGLRAYGMAVYMTDIAEEPEEEVEVDDTGLVAPGAYYSTASSVHQRNLTLKKVGES